jgi:hypothetical protein
MFPWKKPWTGFWKKFRKPLKPVPEKIMSSKTVKLLTPVVFLIAAALVAFLYYKPIELSADPDDREWQARVVIPQSAGTAGFEGIAERMVYEDAVTAKIALQEGESVVAVLTQDLDGDMVDEQILAHRNLLELDSPVSISYVRFDEILGGYRRVWTAPTAVAKPGTTSVYTQDLIGDRSICILIGGMNNADEHTLTVFKMNGAEAEAPFTKIAEIHADGSIQAQETERSRAYQTGLSRGQSFAITAWGRDFSSSNILDQVERIYTYNSGKDMYEQTRTNRIPGSQIEQRRVRELLSGGKEQFESFITGLWYYVGPQGTVDNRQYIYFDPRGGEIIFYGDDIQQVFNWQNSSATRQGLYIASQNISVSTLRRFLDIELESPDSIRVKVFEDVRLKIFVTAPWDGSYRKAQTREAAAPASLPDNKLPYIDASYEGAIGRIVFSPDGSYSLVSGDSEQRGRYVFFLLDNREILEIRPSNGGPSPAGTAPTETNPRETYLVERDSAEDPETITLAPIRLGVRGAQELHESAISLTPVL